MDPTSRPRANDITRQNCRGVTSLTDRQFAPTTARWPAFAIVKRSLICGNDVSTSMLRFSVHGDLSRLFPNGSRQYTKGVDTRGTRVDFRGTRVDFCDARGDEFSVAGLVAWSTTISMKRAMLRYARMSLTMWPWTSVRRKRRPWYL